MQYPTSLTSIILKASVLFALLLGLSACGGGGSGSDSNLNENKLAGRLADGYLVGAKVCVDLNENKKCDASEPFAITTQGGRYLITLSEGMNINDYSIVAEVIPGVVDEDDGLEIDKGYILSAPAGRPTFISPISTMIDSLKRSEGLTNAQAVEQIKEKLGIEAEVDIFGNYIDSSELSSDLKTTIHIIAKISAKIMAENNDPILSSAQNADLSSDNLVKNTSDTINLHIVGQLEVIKEVAKDIPNQSVIIDDELLQSLDTTISVQSLYQATQWDDSSIQNFEVSLVTQAGSTSQQSDNPVYNGKLCTGDTGAEKSSLSGIKYCIKIENRNTVTRYFNVSGETQNTLIYLEKLNNKIQFTLYEKVNGVFIEVNKPFLPGPVYRFRNRLKEGEYKIEFKIDSFDKSDATAEISINSDVVDRVYIEGIINKKAKVRPYELTVGQQTIVLGTLQPIHDYDNKETLFEVIPLRTSSQTASIQLNLGSDKALDVKVVNAAYLSKVLYPAIVLPQDGILWEGKSNDLINQSFVFTRQTEQDAYYVLISTPFNDGLLSIYQNVSNYIRYQLTVTTQSIDAVTFDVATESYKINWANLDLSNLISHAQILKQNGINNWENIPNNEFLTSVTDAKELTSALQTLHAVMSFDEGGLMRFYDNYMNSIDGVHNAAEAVYVTEELTSLAINVFLVLKKVGEGTNAVLDLSSQIKQVSLHLLNKSQNERAKALGSIFLQHGFKILREYQLKKTLFIQSYQGGDSLVASDRLSIDTTSELTQLYILQQRANLFIQHGMNVYLSTTELEERTLLEYFRDRVFAISSAFIPDGAGKTTVDALSTIDAYTKILYDIGKDEFALTQIELTMSQTWNSLLSVDSYHSFYTPQVQNNNIAILIRDQNYVFDEEPPVSTPIPVVISVTPLQATANNLTTFTINGLNFPETITSQIQGADCTNVTQISDTQIEMQCRHHQAEVLNLTTLTQSGGTTLQNGTRAIAFIDNDKFKAKLLDASGGAISNTVTQDGIVFLRIVNDIDTASELALDVTIKNLNNWDKNMSAEIVSAPNQGVRAIDLSPLLNQYTDKSIPLKIDIWNQGTTFLLDSFITVVDFNNIYDDATIAKLTLTDTLRNTGSVNGDNIWKNLKGQEEKHLQDTTTHRIIDFDKIIDKKINYKNNSWEQSTYATSTKNKYSDSTDERTPLLLIHGWQGSVGQTVPAKMQTYENNEFEYWHNFISYYLATPNLHNNYRLYTYHYPSYKHVTYNARMLGNLFTKLPSTSTLARGINSNGVVIMGHSMGGLVARSLIEEHQALGSNAQQLKKLITLDTPHHGSHSSHLSFFRTSFADGLAKDLKTPGATDLMWDNYDSYFSCGGSNYRTWQCDDLTESVNSDVNDPDSRANRIGNFYFDNYYNGLNNIINKYDFENMTNPWLKHLNDNYKDLAYKKKYIFYAAHTAPIADYNLPSKYNSIDNDAAMFANTQLINDKGYGSGGAEPIGSALLSNSISFNNITNFESSFNAPTQYIYINNSGDSSNDNVPYRIFWDYNHERIMNGAYDTKGDWDEFIEQSIVTSVRTCASTAFQAIDGNIDTYNCNSVSQQYSDAAIEYFNNETNSQTITDNTNTESYNPLKTEPVFLVMQKDLLNILSNTAPVANAGADQVVVQGEPLTLNSNKSTDDKEIADYVWTKGSTTFALTESFTTSTLPLGKHTFTLRVADYSGDSDTDTVDVIIYDNTSDLDSDGMSDLWEITYKLDLSVDDALLDSDGDGITNHQEYLNGTNPNIKEIIVSINTPPNANAGLNQSKTTNTIVTLTGEASMDDEGDILTYEWNVESKPVASTMSLFDSSVVSPNFTPDVEGDYVFSLVVNDGKLNSIADYVTITATAGGGSIYTSGKLNDTGITWGGNYPDGNNTSCIGETVEEQDCSKGRDAQAAAGTLDKTGAGHAGFDFTKLDASGNALADQSQDYTTQPWSCVRDNHSGLVWEVKTLVGSGDIHDAINTYRWGGKTALLNDSWGTVYNDWDVLVDGSNSESLCGYSDWRVPEMNALKSIVNYDQVNPAIDTLYFPNTVSTIYWSASPYADGSGGAWYVSFSNGGDSIGGRSGAKLVRLVRGGQ